MGLDIGGWFRKRAIHLPEKDALLLGAEIIRKMKVDTYGHGNLETWRIVEQAYQDFLAGKLKGRLGI